MILNIRLFKNDHREVSLTVLLETFQGASLREAALEVRPEPLAELVKWDSVNIELQLLLELVQVLS